MQSHETATNVLQGSLLIGLIDCEMLKFLIKRHSIFLDCVDKKILSNVTGKSPINLKLVVAKKKKREKVKTCPTSIHNIQVPVVKEILFLPLMIVQKYKYFMGLSSISACPFPLFYMREDEGEGKRRK